MSNLPFVFVDNIEDAAASDDFVLKIAKGIRSKSDLLRCYAKAGNFPSYFGHNWDALEELLRDLSWIEERKVVIVHHDLPLSDYRGELRVYLEILKAVGNDRKRDKPKDFGQARELLVAFPPTVELGVHAALRRS